MENDSIDARVVDHKLKELAPNVSFGTIDIPIDSMAYDMKHSMRGKCLVFNHQRFDSHTGCRPRLGTDRDASSVAKCFHKLQFDVVQHNDLSYQDMTDILTNVSNEDHSERDCIAVVVLTHGDEQCLWARDTKYPTDTLMSYLKADRCPSLSSKPKIFIIQACRGELLDCGAQVVATGVDVVDGPQPVYRIPTIADFVIYYSTAPGHFSFRNTQNGSYFIQTLVSVLNEFSYKYTIDLLTLFTIVNQRVAFEFESYVPNDRQYHKKKQIPCISSMLTRMIYLCPKLNQNWSQS